MNIVVCVFQLGRLSGFIWVLSDFDQQEEEHVAMALPNA